MALSHIYDSNVIWNYLCQHFTYFIIKTIRYYMPVMSKHCQNKIIVSCIKFKLTFGPTDLYCLKLLKSDGY